MARVYSFDELRLRAKVIRDLASTMLRDLNDTQKYFNLLVKSDQESYSAMSAALDARIANLDYIRDDMTDRLGALELTLWSREIAVYPDSTNLLTNVAVTIAATSNLLFTNMAITNIFQNSDVFEIVAAENPDLLGQYTISSSSSNQIYFTPTPVTGSPFTPSGITRSSSTATVNTPDTLVNLGLATGDYVKHSGANQSEYNVTAQITGTGASQYTFAVSGTPATPATGTLVAQKAAASNATDTMMKLRLYSR